MGQNRRHLSENTLKDKTIFPNRMVLECDETIHFHWRNLRLEMSDEDFLSFANMVIKSFSRYKMNNLQTHDNQHVELAKSYVRSPINSQKLQVDEQINLYKKLKYPDAEFYKDDDFVAIRLRDLRIEMSKKEFKSFAQTIIDANEKII